MAIEIIECDQGTPEKHGRLTLMYNKVGKTSDGRLLGLWRCDCGADVYAATSRVRKGCPRSCGCLVIDTVRRISTKHGKKGSPEYSSWQSMIDRCCNKKSKDFMRYGAKGVTVSDKWRRSFEAFFAHVGPRPDGTSLDRIDTRFGYAPGNCRWSTPKEQAENTTVSWIVDIKGIQFPSMEEAARANGVSATTILRWCEGYFDKRRANYIGGGKAKSKPGCRRWRLYSAA